ncbi:MAG: hypothetical protein ACD_6C00102G0004 [uncultured bacterium]|nr:MAG: hypothetical protein ACD_6C00102G0004 [uncultured bacterium]
MAIASAGKPTDCKTIIMVTIPALGIPGAPKDAIIAVAQTTSCCPRLRSSPIKLAINRAAAASYSAVPSIFNCVPSGITKPAVCGRTPKFSCAHFIDKGMVAELELVAKAVIKAARVPLKNVTGSILPKIHSNKGKTTMP